MYTPPQIPAQGVDFLEDDSTTLKYFKKFE
jgi:hypothetical protein